MLHAPPGMGRPSVVSCEEPDAPARRPRGSASRAGISATVSPPDTPGPRPRGASSSAAGPGGRDSGAPAGATEHDQRDSRRAAGEQGCRRVVDGARRRPGRDPSGASTRTVVVGHSQPAHRCRRCTGTGLGRLLPRRRAPARRDPVPDPLLLRLPRRQAGPHARPVIGARRRVRRRRRRRDDQLELRRPRALRRRRGCGRPRGDRRGPWGESGLGVAAGVPEGAGQAAPADGPGADRPPVGGGAVRPGAGRSSSPGGALQRRGRDHVAVAHPAAGQRDRRRGGALDGHGVLSRRRRRQRPADLAPHRRAGRGPLGRGISRTPGRAGPVR